MRDNSIVEVPYTPAAQKLVNKALKTGRKLAKMQEDVDYLEFQHDKNYFRAESVLEKQIGIVEKEFNRTHLSKKNRNLGDISQQVSYIEYYDPTGDACFASKFIIHTVYVVWSGSDWQEYHNGHQMYSMKDATECSKFLKKLAAGTTKSKKK
jgi:hypothetical protein